MWRGRERDLMIWWKFRCTIVVWLGDAYGDDHMNGVW